MVTIKFTLLNDTTHIGTFEDYSDSILLINDLSKAISEGARIIINAPDRFDCATCIDIHNFKSMEVL